MDINNKVAIVTGGASGLGEATVRRYLELGASVAIFDMNDERGQALVAELGDKTRYYNVDVSNEDAVQAAVDAAAEAFGGIHICNNFAGIGIPAKTVDRDGNPMALKLFRKVIDVNLIGTFNVLSSAAAPMCKQNAIDEDGQKGVIINTASIAAYEGQIGQASYSASKGGVVGMTLPVARDLAKEGIRVNTIVPGLIHTPMFDNLPEAAVESLSKSPLNPRRLGKPEEIAHLAQSIIENDYINGECIRIDGGIRMQPK